MQDIYKNNIAILKNRFAELAQSLEDVHAEEKVEAAYTPSGLPTFFYRNGSAKKTLFHSQYNPRKEAYQFLSSRDFSSARWVFALGMGFGYHIKQLLKNHLFRGEIFVFEPCLRIFKSALKHCDLTDVLAEPRVHFLVEPEPEKVKDFIYKTPWFRENIYESKFIYLPVYRQVFNDYFSVILDALNVSLSRLLMANIVTAQLSRGWERNCLDNLPRILNSVPLSSFFQKFSGHAGVIVSAGPSLDKNAAYLKNFEGKAVIISVGTALKSLLKAGVRPDFVVALDADEIILKQFEGISDFRDIWLLTEVCVSPKIVSLFYPRLSFFSSMANPFLTYLCEQDRLNDMFIHCGGTVSNSALDIARKLGLNPLIFVGQDLCVEDDGRSHANGTMHEGNRYKIDLENLNFLTVPGNYAEKVVTLRNFFTFLRWIENYICRYPGVEFINATAGGARIQGTKLLSLEEVKERHLKGPALNIQEGLYKQMLGQIPCGYPAQILKKIRQAVRELKSQDKKLVKCLTTSNEMANFLNGKNAFSESQEKRFLNRIKKFLEDLAELKRLDLLDYGAKLDLLAIAALIKNSRIKAEGYTQAFLRLPKLFSNLIESSELVQRCFNGILLTTKEQKDNGGCSP